MDNGTDPGQVRTSWQRIHHKIPGHEPNSIKELGIVEALPCHGDHVWQIKERGLRRWTCAQKSNGPSRGRTANVQEMREPERVQGSDDLVGDGGGDIMH